MKFAAALLALFGSAAAYAPANKAKKATSVAFSVDTIPGALPPVGLFDPLGFAAKADEPTLKRYREAELTHGRVAMLAVSPCRVLLCVSHIIQNQIIFLTTFF